MSRRVEAAALAPPIMAKRATVTEKRFESLHIIVECGWGLKVVEVEKCELVGWKLEGERFDADAYIPLWLKSCDAQRLDVGSSSPPWLEHSSAKEDCWRPRLAPS